MKYLNKDPELWKNQILPTAHITHLTTLLLCPFKNDLILAFLINLKLKGLSVSLLSPRTNLDRVPFSSPAFGLMIESASKGSTTASKLQVHTRGPPPFTSPWSQAKCELELLGTRVRQRHVIWTRLEVKSYFPLTTCLLLLWKLLQGGFSPSPHHCPPPHSAQVPMETWMLLAEAGKAFFTP